MRYLQIELHQAQGIILDLLRHNPALRYTKLCKASGLESDVFKFHIQKLVKAGCILKMPGGEYSLTEYGKNYANNLNDRHITTLRQSKQSVLFVASRFNPDGQEEILLQRRLRYPYYGMWSFIGGPVPWGLKPEAAAEKELLKQTGIQAKARLSAFYHEYGYSAQTGDLLEDTFFSVMTATIKGGELMNNWRGGSNKWIPKNQLPQYSPQFSSLQVVMDMLANGEMYIAQDVTYRPDTY